MMVNAVGGSSILNQIAMAEMRQRIFNNADANSDGKISKDEMTKVVANMRQGGPNVDDIFSKLDTNGDGSITQSEFSAGDKPMGRPPEGLPPMMEGMGNMSSADFVKQLLSDADSNVDGKISKDELTRVMANASGGSSVNDIMSALDTNGDGFISESELLAASQADRRAQVSQNGSGVDSLFNALDTNGDGSISKSEFEAWMASGNNSTQSTTTTNDLAETLLKALGKQSQTAASVSTSGSQDSTSATSIAALLSNAIKSYAQSSSNSWSQSGLEGLPGTGLLV